MKIRAVVMMTLHELSARKVLLTFAVIGNLFLLLAFIGSFFLPSDLSSLLGANIPQGAAVNDLFVTQSLQAAAGFIQFAALLLGIFTTAGILPSALEKGTVDLLLSKPLPRGHILLGKSIAAVAMVAANVVWFMLGIWLIVSFKFGVWNTGFILSTVPMLFMFAVLYAPMALIGVATRSTPLAIILLYVFLYLISPILRAREIIAGVAHSPVVADVLSGFYYVLPKPDDINLMMSALISGGEFSWMPVWSSALFAAAMYALAYFALRRKDF